MVVWEFSVKPGLEAEFLKAYGPEGDWAQLFRQSREFLRVELVRSVQQSNRFFTFDYWASRDAYYDFCDQYAEAYGALDEKLATLTEWERRIGAFPTE